MARGTRAVLAAWKTLLIVIYVTAALSFVVCAHCSNAHIATTAAAAAIVATATTVTATTAATIVATTTTLTTTVATAAANGLRRQSAAHKRSSCRAHSGAKWCS